ncbi:hypothetical protein GH146_02680 [archaeon]|nr:hypothetical protein [archaeon]
MKKLLKSKKAMSPVIAAIILIAVTVAVSIAVAAWMGSLTIGFMETEEMRIASVTFTGTDTINIIVVNSGTEVVEVTAATVTFGSTTVSLTDLTDTVAAETTDTVTLTDITIIVAAGTTYDIELITAAGNTYSYSATA